MVFSKVLGIRGRLREESQENMTPQFMMELYNTVTDEDGKTRGKNPYGAKVVRSFVEIGRFLPRNLLFSFLC